MFERRLWWFSAFLGVIALIIGARLAQLQVLEVERYEELAARLMTRPVRYLRAPRGSVLDRNGTPLIQDVPSSNIAVHFGVLTGNADYVRAVAIQMRRRGDFPAAMPLSEVVSQVYHAIDDMRQRLAALAGCSVADLVARGRLIESRVLAIRNAVMQRSPTVRAIVEEQAWHPLLEDVESEVALAVRLDMEKYPWIRVEPASRRTPIDAASLSHLLGRLGPASPEHIAADPAKEDEFRRLLAGDRCGISGVEKLGEFTLRGRRGRIIEELDGDLIERIEPSRGEDIFLTIDLELQEQVYAIVGEAVERGLHPCGGAAVVLDVETREVLALVSYPSYPSADFTRNYDELSHDTRRMPLFFRAVQGQYPPGSTCKVIAAVGALSEGLVTESSRFHCTGHLLPGKPNQFRCWIYNQFGATHDWSGNPNGQNAEDAIRNSCNIYFFKVGERLGGARLCTWFSRFGLGRASGTGLIEETPGIVPTEDWLLARSGRRHRAADAWNYSIGQGEVTATPIQTANVAATIASGAWRPARLGRDGSDRWLGDSAPELRFDERVLRPIRRGMWRVVNETGGTANPHAALGEAARGYELCGKTGSAQAAPRVVTWRFTLEWPDGRREDVIAASAEEAMERFVAPRPKIIGRFASGRYPALREGEKLPSHAWFMGYTQPRSTARGAAPAGRSYAISVLIEYGDSGGKVAGPVAKRIAELLVTRERW